MSEQKICKDCKYCQHTKPNIFSSFFLDKEEKYYCLRELKIVEKLDAISGETIVETYGKVSCISERFSCAIPEYHCGYEGKYWEPKE